MSASIFFDTQIITRVSDGQISAETWTRLLTSIRANYQYCVSLNTFLELLNALGGGDEARFASNRKRLLVLVDVPGCKFLPLPGEFLRQVVLGLPLERQDFAPEMLQTQWMSVIKAAKSKHALMTGVPMSRYGPNAELLVGIDLGMVRSQFQEGQKLWIEELSLARAGSKGMPPKELYAGFHLHFFAHAETTKANLNKLRTALDAAYCHLARIHHESTKSNYKFQNHPQDWIDNQQLMYLADSENTFITADKRLIAKLHKSTQRAQVRFFDDFIRTL